MINRTIIYGLPRYACFSMARAYVSFLYNFRGNDGKKDSVEENRRPMVG